MPPSRTLVVLFASLATCIDLSPGSTVLRGFVQFPVHATTTHGAGIGQLRRRQAPGAEVLNLDNGTAYSITFGVGTPPQPVSVVLDTGSSEFWVNPDCETVVSDRNREICEAAPRYTMRASETARQLLDTSSIGFAKGFVRLAHVEDSVSLGAGTTLENFHFGIAESSIDIFAGVLGLGPRPASQRSDHFVSALATQKLIESRVFSINLGSVDQPQGAVIFGGIDMAKFSGTLDKVPLISEEEAVQKGVDRRFVRLASVAVTSPNHTSSTIYQHDPATVTASYQALIDSGSTLSVLPRQITRGILAHFPDAVALDGGIFLVDCIHATSNGTVDFGFNSSGSDKVIRVPHREFIWRQGSECALAMLESADDENRPLILGTPFLRAAYLVWDLDNGNVHLAQAAAGCGRSDIIRVGRGVDAVPALTGSCVAGPAGWIGGGNATWAGGGSIRGTGVLGGPIMTSPPVISSGISGCHMSGVKLAVAGLSALCLALLLSG
ncbi:hypothetical protein MCOR07_009027 [Pyricularia oryzae]|uniref:Peptidase A1 domain-containing protein n=1 Tax=Pyricularia grisea TaxID=148305 RepID=A0ABQ8NMN3_PYRGI|nr:hypothetical protein MCOR33_005050 [Pyricularia grisea]KAI6430012.1 hypothetical protein MCOR21_004779 [Pyricularia oryzae]KAI6527957.1 hypothetical protein MCOR05_008600 [Pyricularia oryzae]KAI6563923.1 hypothetical protein MCOR09_007309 [Pyricularia oryzae]KAI6613709.1 hypothetical protein MCOR07_009027 [Pyricularia oryzae]